MPKFVILRHETPLESRRVSHWDFMLEVASGLETWALEEMPQAGLVTRAKRLAVHRKAYLDFEGPLSEGRGSVRRCDEGDYTVLEWTPRRVQVVLHGKTLRCKGALQADEEVHCWSAAFSESPT